MVPYNRIKSPETTHKGKEGKFYHGNFHPKPDSEEKTEKKVDKKKTEKSDKPKAPWGE